MTTNPNYQSQISRLEALPGKLNEAVSNLTDNQLDTPYRENGWTIRQVVHHLADAHANSLIRLKLMLTEDYPTLKPYDQDKWAATPDASTIPIEPSLKMIDGLHYRIVTFFRNLNDDDFSRSANHPEVGEINIEFMLNTYADHGDNHLAQITGLITKMNW